MNITTLPVSDLKHPEKNVRQHPEHQINEMARSLEMFGQIRPVVVDETHTILAGNGMVMALRQMGITEAKVLILSGLSEAEKKKVMIADNRIFALGIDHQDNTLSLIESIGDFDIPGFDEGILQDLIGDIDLMDDQIEQYGILTDEEETEFHKAAESKERAIQQAETPEPPRVVLPPQQDEEDILPSPTPRVELPAEPAGPAAKIIKCPHCGGNVWL